jgi:hypothetical protein
MATDPARTKKRTPKEVRKLMQDACREDPCIQIKKGLFPTCILCVHERKIK